MKWKIRLFLECAKLDYKNAVLRMRIRRARRKARRLERKVNESNNM